MLPLGSLGVPAIHFLVQCSLRCKGTFTIHLYFRRVLRPAIREHAGNSQSFAFLPLFPVWRCQQLKDPIYDFVCTKVGHDDIAERPYVVAEVVGLRPPSVATELLFDDCPSFADNFEGYSVGGF